MKEILNALPGVISTIALLIAGFWAYFRLRVERSHTPHIELDLDCNLLGPEGDHYIAEVIIVVNNKGLVRQDFESMTLRVRGIAEGDELEFYTESRLQASHKLLDAQLIKKTEADFLFVEPGVKHLITYATKLPTHSPETGKKIRYFFVRTKFYYDPKNPHSIERVYSIDQCLNGPKKLYCD